MPKPKSNSAKPALRRFRRADLPELIRLRKTLWPDCSPAMTRYEISACLRRPQSAAIYVLDRGDGRLGGFIELSVRPRVDGSMSERVGYVEGWFVDPDLRGAGWGRRLIRVAEDWTAALGLTELASDAELANPRGIRAHRACGFRETFRVVQFLKRVRRS